MAFDCASSRHQFCIQCSEIGLLFFVEVLAYNFSFKHAFWREATLLLVFVHVLEVTDKLSCSDAYDFSFLAIFGTVFLSTVLSQLIEVHRLQGSVMIYNLSSWLAFSGGGKSWSLQFSIEMPAILQFIFIPFAAVLLCSGFPPQVQVSPFQLQAGLAGPPSASRETAVLFIIQLSPFFYSSPSSTTRGHESCLASKGTTLDRILSLLSYFFTLLHGLTGRHLSPLGRTFV